MILHAIYKKISMQILPTHCTTHTLDKSLLLSHINHIPQQFSLHQSFPDNYLTLQVGAKSSSLTLETFSQLLQHSEPIDNSMI
jgi:hypothetical protein